MIKVQPDQISATVEALKQTAASAVATECTDEFGLFEAKLNELDAAVREVQQGMWLDEAQAVIDHLESGDLLTEPDVEVIRTFLISDAEHYLAVENNYGEWLDELQRLMGELSGRATTISRDTIGEFRGLLKDAIRLVPDIRNYLEERMRVEKFNVALHTVDTSARTMLARVLKEQLRSPSR